jgi:hypothetical protein
MVPWREISQGSTAWTTFACASSGCVPVPISLLNKPTDVLRFKEPVVHERIQNVSNPHEIAP